MRPAAKSDACVAGSKSSLGRVKDLSSIFCWLRLRLAVSAKLELPTIRSAFCFLGSLVLAQPKTKPNSFTSPNPAQPEPKRDDKKAHASVKAPFALEQLSDSHDRNLPAYSLSREGDCLFSSQKASPLLPGRSNATPNKKRFGMSFEAPLGLSTSNHPYVSTVNIVSNNKPKRHQKSS